MRSKRIIGAMLLAVVIMQSCEKDDTAASQETLVQKTVSNLPADTIIGLVNGQPFGAGKFTFYSLENNTIVASTDSNSLKWDIAMRGTAIITNGGNSGPGSGGAFVYVGTFDELKAVPADSVFRKDNVPVSYAIPFGSNRGWYVYNPITTLITPIPGRVLVIKTASGKYAKMEILNYYKGGVTPDATASDADKLNKQRYYTFRYSYQGNGSTSFQ